MSKFIIALGIVGIAGYGLFQAAERYSKHIPQIVEVSALETISGAATYVRDGDTIEVDGVPVSFGSLDCPEATYADGADALKFMR